MESLFQDVTFGLRMLRKNPAFTWIAAVTLALGIGANTAIFSMVNSLLLRPLPVPQAQQIAVLAFSQGTGGIANQFSIPEERDIAAQVGPTLSAVFGYQFGLDGISRNGKAERLLTNYVTGNYFTTLGIKPALGRFIVPGEGETPGADPVVVLDYNYWRSNFGSDPNVVNSKVLVDGRPVTIIGVAPAGFYGVTPLVEIQAYLPLGMLTLEGQPADFMTMRGARSMTVLARVAPGATYKQAQAALTVVGQRMAQEHPAEEKNFSPKIFEEVHSRPQPGIDQVMLLTGALFLGLAVMVLLLACLNVANILLVRATVREGEMAIRAALGAGRGRLVRQLLTESILLALVGAAAGVGLGRWASFALANMSLNTQLPIHLDFGFDWRVFGFATGAAILTGILVGVVPALRASRHDLNTVLHQGGRSLVGGSHRMRSALVVAQVAGSLMLLIVAALFARSLVAAQRADMGFDPTNVTKYSMDPGEIGYSEAQGLAFYKNLLTRVNALPGVETAALASSVPLSYYNNADSMIIDGYQPPAGEGNPNSVYGSTSPGYLETMRIPLLEGRSFGEADDASAPYAAIINEELAHKYWPKQDPIGRKFRMVSDPKHEITIVGLAKNSRESNVSGPFGNLFYVPLQQHYQATSLQTLLVRSRGNSPGMTEQVEATIRSLAPDLPVFEVQTMTAGMDTLNGLLIFKLGAVLAAVLGGLGLVLSIVGVYGVISYSASQRTQEIGIRMALGASPVSILTMVLRQGLIIVGCGLVVGVGAAAAASLVVKNLVLVSATDPLTYVGVSALLATVALAACYMPARRTMRVDPMVALRHE